MKKVYLSDAVLYQAINDILDGYTPEKKTLVVLQRKNFLLPPKKKRTLESSLTPLAYEFIKQYEEPESLWQKLGHR